MYGQYGQDFTSSDGASFMIVALTGRHFRDLTELTGTTKAVAALAETLGADFTDEGQRYEHRSALFGLFNEWFSQHTAQEITDALSASSVLWDRYRTFAEAARGDRVTANPMFTALDQPRIGEYLAPGLPMSIGGVYPAAEVAPALGDDTVGGARGVARAERGRDRRTHRCGHGRNEQATGAARPAAGRCRGHVDRPGQRSGGKAVIRRPVHGTEPRGGVPDRRRRPARRPTCICSSCAAARPVIRSSTP